MNVLGIDTSNQPMSVAVWSDGILTAELTVNVKRNHSIQLMPAIDQVLKLSNITPKELNQIIVAEGPGSFTGIRIGMTTAKSMAWTLNIPIKTVSSLKLLAGNLIYQKDYICPFFDARRGNVYTGLYKQSDGELNLIKDDHHTDMNEWLSELKALNDSVYFISPNGGNFNTVVLETLGEQAVLVNHTLNIPRAGMLLAVSRDQSASNVHEVSPNYHRITQAEANWKKEHGEGLTDGSNSH